MSVSILKQEWIVLSGLVFSLTLCWRVEAEPSQASIESALKNRVCYEYYWWGRNNYKLGKSVDMSVRIDGDSAFIWTENLVADVNIKDWANYFTFVVRRGVPMIAASYGYSVQAMKDDPDFKENRRKVFSGNVSSITANIPDDCTPKMGALFSGKDEILAAVETSVASEIHLLAKEDSRIPQTIKILVADFEQDYPSTFVFVPSTGDVFAVALFDERYPLVSSAIKEKSLPIQPVNNRSELKALKEKIAKFGIERDVQLKLSR